MPERNPTPVEVTMQMGAQAAYGLRTLLIFDDIDPVWLECLGDSYVDITSERARRVRRPRNNTELKARDVPSIQQVVDTSQQAFAEASAT